MHIFIDIDLNYLYLIIVQVYEVLERLLLSLEPTDASTGFCAPASCPASHTQRPATGQNNILHSTFCPKVAGNKTGFYIRQSLKFETHVSEIKDYYK